VGGPVDMNDAQTAARRLPSQPDQTLFQILEHIPVNANLAQ